MFVSLIVATYNRRSLMIRCMESLIRQTYPRERYEIIVCCDGCDDETEAGLRPYIGRGVTVFSIVHSGKVAAVNAALGKARGEIGIFLDDDMEANEAFIDSHVRAHQKAGGEFLAITGYSEAVVPPDCSELVFQLAKGYEQYFEGLGASDHAPCPGDLTGGNFSIPLRQLRELGSFNETYVFQRDDTEFAVRWMERGFRIGFAPDARTKMFLDLTPSALIDRAESRGRNDYRLGLEHPWCLKSLAYYRVLITPNVCRRWRVLWAGAPFAAAVFRTARLYWPNNLRLQNWEYAARYCLGIRKQAGSWEAFLGLRRSHASQSASFPHSPSDRTLSEVS